MPIQIRKAEATDREDWARMRHRLWDDWTVERHLTDIDNMLKDDKFTGYLAIDNAGQAVGFAEICIRDYANGCTQQPVPFLEGIWIDEHYRRSGVGSLLIKTITSELKAQGFIELCSDILENNLQSHRAHENWGFHEMERVIYFRKGLD